MMAMFILNLRRVSAPSVRGSRRPPSCPGALPLSGRHTCRIGSTRRRSRRVLPMRQVWRPDSGRAPGHEGGRRLPRTLGADTRRRFRMNIAIMKIDQLLPNPYQTREREDSEQVAEVAGSILKVGLLQVPVGRRTDGKGVQLAFGHTRLAAYRKLVTDGHRDFEQMPVDVRELSDQGMFELAIRENLERKDLTPIEEARAMATYRDQF